MFDSCEKSILLLLLLLFLLSDINLGFRNNQFLLFRRFFYAVFHFAIFQRVIRQASAIPPLHVRMILVFESINAHWRQQILILPRSMQVIMVSNHLIWVVMEKSIETVLPFPFHLPHVQPLLNPMILI